ncbi:MAG: hypothetical protein WC784_02535 [Candidatus Shapirobacteria bacterium]|jgi:REP element-mobilizing transposase RayT
MKWQKFPFKIEKQYRLKNWDYSNNGYYFITICTQDRQNLFRNFKSIPPVGTDPSNCSFVGTDPCVCSSSKNINPSTKNSQTLGEINVIGQMIEKWWLKIPQKFPAIILDEFTVMPNHFHGLLIIKNNLINKFKEQTHGSVPTMDTIDNNIFGNVGLLGQSIQWFKTMTTSEYIKNIKNNNWPKFSKRLWQTRFHDEIILNEKHYWAAKQYIKNNVLNWNKDKDNILLL